MERRPKRTTVKSAKKERRDDSGCQEEDGGEGEGKCFGFRSIGGCAAQTCLSDVHIVANIPYKKLFCCYLHMCPAHVYPILGILKASSS